MHGGAGSGAGGCKAVQRPGGCIRQRGAGQGAGRCTGRCIGRCTGGARLWTLHWGCSTLGGARGGAGRRAADSVIRREQRALRLSSHRIAARSGSRSCAWRPAALSRLSPGKPLRLSAGAGCSSWVPGAFGKSWEPEEPDYSLGLKISMHPRTGRGGPASLILHPSKRGGRERSHSSVGRTLD